MILGLSTYSLFWHASDRTDEPWSLAQMVDHTAELGGDVFQICDHPEIESMDAPAVRSLAAHAVSAGVRLELGTRGVRAEHLRRYLALAEALGAGLVRSMWVSGVDRPTPSEAEAELRAALGGYADAGVTLALETYEQVPTETLAGVVEQIGHARLGICLDPANTVAALETPDRVIERVADLTLDLHVKDFAFRRSPGLIGFELTGAPLGTGLLPAMAQFDRLRPDRTGISCIIEHWLPWQGDAGTTVALEDDWNRIALAWMRAWADHADR